MECSLVSGSFGAFRSEIESPALQAVADHWDEARKGRMPSWAGIRPSSIAPYLTRIWSYRRDPGTGEFIGRLAGNQITLGFGRSFRGTPLRDIHPPHVFEQSQLRLDRLVRGPWLYRGTGKLFRHGDYVTAGERIILPLAADGETADGALGVSDFAIPPQAVLQRQVELIYDTEQWFALSE